MILLGMLLSIVAGSGVGVPTLPLSHVHVDKHSIAQCCFMEGVCPIIKHLLAVLGGEEKRRFRNIYRGTESMAK